jgi:hypothetical protein
VITTTKERLVLSRDEPKQRDISRTGLATVTDRLPLFLGGCLIALAGIAAFAPNLLFRQAEAALAETCLNVANPADDDDAGQITGWQLDGTTFDDVRGIKSNVQVASSAECQRISTLNILSPTQNGVFEFGWIRGWWGSSPCVNVNYNTFYMQPTLFQVSVRNDGTYQCRFSPTKHPDGGQADTFQASVWCDARTIPMPTPVAC